MICFIALIIFGLLGLFSATHRKIALEAFDCVFRRLTFRPCNSSLDKRLKSEIIGRLMKKNQKIAKYTFKHFEIISWIFTILTIVSMIYAGIGMYNFIQYGNCNGEFSNGVCIYQDIGGAFIADEKCENPSCQNENCTCKNKEECLSKDLTSCEHTCIYANNT